MKLEQWEKDRIREIFEYYVQDFILSDFSNQKKIQIIKEIEDLSFSLGVDYRLDDLRQELLGE